MKDKEMSYILFEYTCFLFIYLFILKIVQMDRGEHLHWHPPQSKSEYHNKYQEVCTGWANREARLSRFNTSLYNQIYYLIVSAFP